jgi:transcription elongation factor GreA
MAGAAAVGDGDAMTQLTGADYDALVHELADLRDRHRLDLERRLRDARAFGSPGDNDEVLSVMEDAAVMEARIARLEELVRSASVIDGQSPFDGRAGLGCAVRVVDGTGRTTEYVIVGRRNPGSGPYDVSAASPVGKALLGAGPGETVEVTLPNGRRRTLEVVEVVMPAAAQAA